MAKKRLSKKHKNNKVKKIRSHGIFLANETTHQIQINELNSNHVSLCALAPVIEDKKVFEPIYNNVMIPQKKLLYSPTDKLVFLTLGIMSGMQTVYDINQTVRVDQALLKAFGYKKCADQSVIQETLNATIQENIQQMESALKTIWDQNNLTVSLLEKAQKENKPLTIDIDLSGHIASKNAEQSKKGYFSSKKNAYGRQLARVLVPDTQEIIAESLYPGNTVSWDNAVFKAMIAKMEHNLCIQTKSQRSSIRLRLDGGFGTDKNINHALWGGYQLLTKMRCSGRARKLSQSVTQWVDIPSDSENNPRQAGWVTKPYRYSKKTKQLAIRKTTKKGYTYSVLVVTDLNADLMTVVTDYDARGGTPENSFCQDSQGLSSRKRRKRSFLAQQMLMLLNQLAHNIIRWMQNWLVNAVEQFATEPDASSVESPEDTSLVVKTLKERGMKRFVRQLLSLRGKVIMKDQRICKVVFNPLYPLINRIITAFRALLKPYGIIVSSDEILD